LTEVLAHPPTTTAKAATVIENIVLIIYARTAPLRMRSAEVKVAEAILAAVSSASASHRCFRTFSASLAKRLALWGNTGLRQAQRTALLIRLIAVCPSLTAGRK
jgi:hypothetical protein